MNESSIPRWIPNAVVHDTGELIALSSSITDLIIDSCCCNEVKAIDFAEWRNVKVIEIGDDCFKYAKKVKMIGLHALERVVIGKNCFYREWEKKDLNCQFLLKDCEKVKELRIGSYSFHGFCVCEIENVNSLEVIEMGDSEDGGYNFMDCPILVLRSDQERSRMTHRVAQAEITLVWTWCLPKLLPSRV